MFLLSFSSSFIFPPLFKKSKIKKAGGCVTIRCGIASAQRRSEFKQNRNNDNTLLVAPLGLFFFLLRRNGFFFDRRYIYDIVYLLCLALRSRKGPAQLVLSPFKNITSALSSDASKVNERTSPNEI